MSCQISKWFVDRMHLWSTWTGRAWLRACWKMTQRPSWYRVCPEWPLFSKHILCQLPLVESSKAQQMTIWERCHFLFLNLELTFEKEITEQCIQVFEIGIAEHSQRQAEVNAFFSGQTQAIKDSQQRAMKIVANFELQHKEVTHKYPLLNVFCFRLCCFINRIQNKNCLVCIRGLQSCSSYQTRTKQRTKLTTVKLRWTNCAKSSCPRSSCWLASKRWVCPNVESSREDSGKSFIKNQCTIFK